MYCIIYISVLCHSLRKSQQTTDFWTQVVRALSEGERSSGANPLAHAVAILKSGCMSWLLLPTKNVQIFSQALALFAQEMGVGPEKRNMLLDQAGWHTSAKLIVPEGMHLMFLPPYSPELQPAEHLWLLSNELLTNRAFVSLCRVFRQGGRQPQS